MRSSGCRGWTLRLGRRSRKNGWGGGATSGWKGYRRRAPSRQLEVGRQNLDRGSGGVEGSGGLAEGQALWWLRLRLRLRCSGLCQAAQWVALPRYLQFRTWYRPASCVERRSDGKPPGPRECWRSHRGESAQASGSHWRARCLASQPVAPHTTPTTNHVLRQHPGGRLFELPAFSLAIVSVRLRATSPLHPSHLGGSVNYPTSPDRTFPLPADTMEDPKIKCATMHASHVWFKKY